MDGIETIAYEIAVRALAQQERAVDELRARSGTLLTASALIASFLGGQAIDRVGLDAFLILALVAFVAVVLLCAHLLLPKRGLIFALDGPAAAEALQGLEHDEAVRRLVYWIHDFRVGNQPTIDEMASRFRWAVGSLLVETALLSVGLALS